MKRPSVDLVGVVLLAGAGALWLGRSPVANALASSTIGAPLVALLLRAIAVLVALAALYRLRGLFVAAAQGLLALVDAGEAKLAALPTATGRALKATVIALTVGGLTAVVFGATSLGGYLETRALDLFFRLRFPERSQVELATGLELPSANKHDDVVVLALDDETVAHLGWPMPRYHYARLIDAVAEAKPQSLTFDVSIVDPSREHPDWDEAIGQAVQAAGNVSFTFAVARAGSDTVLQLSQPALDALGRNTIPWHESAATLPEYAEIVGGDVAPLPVIDPIAKSAKALAMANVMLDGQDDVLRHSLVVARLGKRLLPSLSLRLAADSLGVPLTDVKVVPGQHVDVGGKVQIPIDHLGRTLIRYQGRHDARGNGPFRYVSLWSILRVDSTITLVGNPLGDDQRFQLDEQTKVTRDGAPVALAEVERLLSPGAVIQGTALYSTDPGRVVELRLDSGAVAPAEPQFELVDETTLRFTTTLGALQRKRVDLSALAGKHLLVGSTALAAADLRHSPLGEIPGVEHHAAMLVNLLHQDFFTPTPRWAGALIPVGAGLLAAALGVTLSSEIALLLTALLMLVSLTVSFASFSAGRYLPIVSPPVALALTALVCLVLAARASRNAHAKAEQEREFVRSTFGRYLTEQVVQQLLDAPDGLRLGGKREFVTIMMTDLRGFTSMCGSMEPEGVVRLLNHYLEAMTRIIAKYGGTIDEFIGDAILTVFGAPLPLEQTEARAVACAIEMLNAMPAVNAWNKENGLPEVEMGIGVHSGEVVLGNIGSELRAKYGIVGSTINLTSRVESFTVGGQVLISETTRARCGDLLKLGQSQVVSPKGVKGTMTIHEALGVLPPFEVTLQSASANEQLLPPSTPFSLRFAPVKGKEVAELKYTAHVEAISELGLELKVDLELTTLQDLQLRVVDGDGLRPGDLYGKIIKTNVRPNVVYLRLTSVPPELKPFMEAARGHAHQAAAVHEPALVSS